MASVLDDPAARLYAGALLGKALSKQAGEVSGQEGPLESLTQRRATLQAGIASGRLKPSALSPSDAGLLGDALSKQQHISSGPLGFIGGFAGNLLKGGGEFGESLLHIPQGLFSIGKSIVDPHTYGAFGTSSKGTTNLADVAKGVGKGIAHDFSSPRQFYEHPFNPLLDVAAVASGGSSAAVKGAAELAKAGKGGSAIARVARLGATTGREARILSPSFTPENAESLAAAGVKPAEYAPAYSGNPFTKYAIQKPLDTSISKLSKLQRRLAPQVKPLDELRGEYLGKKLVNRAHATINSGDNQALSENKPLKDLIQTVGEMYKPNHIKGEYEWEATVLHSAGINTLDKLDEYVEAVRRGDEDALDEVGGGQINKDLNEQQRKAIEYRTEQKYQDTRFRGLIEDPTNLMKEAAYHLRRVNVLHAMQLDIDPITSMESAFGRVRALTNKTTEELAHELPKGLRPESQFAIGLQGLRDKMVGEDFTQPSVDEIKQVAMHLPYGTMEQRMAILQQAVESFLKDAQGVPKVDSIHDPAYLQGNNLFEKVSTALSDKLGVPQEQAQAFARGIKLGGPESPIYQTYIPSFSGAGLKFGDKPDLLRARVGRALGVAKFKPLEDLADNAPNYMEIKRPFNPRTVSAQTIGLGPSANYLKEADYGAFVRGYADLRPEGIIKLASTIQRDLVFNKLNSKLLSRIAVKGDDGEPLWVSGRGQAIERMGHIFETHYEVVPVDVYRNYLGTEAGMLHRAGQMVETWKDENISAEEALSKLEDLSDEAAQEFVSGLTQGVASGNQKYLIIPRTYIKTLVDHTRLTEAGKVGRFMQAIIGRWKAAVLSYSPAWLLRTTTGHGLVAVIDGTINPNAWKAAHHFEGDSLILGDRPVVGEQKVALRPWSKAGSEKILGNRLPPGVNQGSLMHELGDVGQAAREAKLRTIPRGIQSGVHTTTNYQRRAIFLAKLNKLVRQRMTELDIDFAHPGGFWDAKNLDAVLDPEFQKTVLKYPDLIEHTFDQLSHASYTFGEMAPWERRLIRNGIPFYGWYKFISKFVWSMPINYPGRAAAISQLGKIGEEDTASMGAIPPYLEGALFFDHHNLNDTRYINLYGLNPLGDVANPFGKGGFGEGVVRLGQTSPFIQAGLSAFGVNPVTGTTEEIDPRTGFETGKYGEVINVKTGQVYPGPAPVHGLERGLGTFIRAFPEVRTLELLENKGNPTYPESIPIIDNKVKPISPLSRHGANLGEALQQEFGVQVRHIDVGKYAANQLKKVTEARKKNPKTIARGKAKLSQ